MEIIAKQLIFYVYNEDYLNKNCSPNTIKDENLEWNENEHKTNPFASEINDNDIVISIRDLEKQEDYGLFFFKKQKVGDVFLFTITKGIIDSNLPESYIRTILQNCLTTLVNGNYLRNDRLIANNNYPFYEPHVSDTIGKVSNVILSLFRTSRDGIVDLSTEQTERIKKSYNKNTPK